MDDKHIDKPCPPYVTTERELDQRLGNARPRRPDQSSPGPDPDIGPPPTVTPDVQPSEEARNQQRTGRKNVAESGRP